MNTFKHKCYLIPKGLLSRLMLSLIVGLSANTTHAAIAQSPLFLAASVPPIVMLTMGRDHRLYFQAYNDASDLDGDGLIDVGYKPGIDYYGYFDSHKCYSYGSGKFTPISTTLNKTCANAWSGDFLNYLTTSRMDALRKVLYGGYRSTDTTTSTVLKRVYIPQDAHSWGNEYTSVLVDGYNISDYTPLSLPTGSSRHLFASTTWTSAASDPLLMVLTNQNKRIWDWVSKENPEADASLGTPALYKVYVDVCLPGLLESNCKAYSNGVTTTYKPTGLLQTYGENDTLAFGLISGSYKKNISGGVLRKNIESFKNEVDPNTGIFTNVNGIVNAINSLRTVTFSYSGNRYDSGWIETRPINEGEAAEWGNPVAEMMYEGLRYFAGKPGPTPAFSINPGDVPDATLGLPLPNWLDPYTAAPSGGGYLSCANPIQLVISDINTSYDTDQLPGSYFNPSFTGDLTGLDVSGLADTIWAGESEASSVFIGQSGATYDGAPTAKPASSFKDIRGLAPEEPTKLGGFYAGSVSLYGTQTDLNTATGDQKAETLAVALASPLPRIEMSVNGKKVTVVPFAKSVGGCLGIVGTQGSFQPTNQFAHFYVKQIVNNVNGGLSFGKFLLSYEDSEQAADYDMDAIVEYTVSVNASNQVEVKLDSQYAAGCIVQHMGYVISGTTADGVYLDVRDFDTATGSDPDYFLDTPPGQQPGGNWADGTALPLTTTRTFTVGGGSTTSASFIKHEPLWYAAKWGAADLNGNGILDLNEWDADNNGVPDSYFLVTNAGNLSNQLSKAFSKISAKTSSASAVAANSAQLNTGTQVYQAMFNSKDWSGKLQAFAVDINNGTLTLGWEASALLPAYNVRNIYTYNPLATAGSPRGVPFLWASLTCPGPSSSTCSASNIQSGGTSQQDYLNTLLGVVDTKGTLRLDWLRGDSANEQSTSNPGGFRNRNNNPLGDIINSDPIYVGAEDFGYGSGALPGSSSYSSFLAAKTSRKPMLYVGANDGMLHGFDAGGTGGQEIFAYIPNALFPELSKLTSPNYTHQYYVDGMSGVGDVYDGNNWRTLLAGATGAGGRAVFALDVTNPAGFGPGSALWEYTNTTKADGTPNISTFPGTPNPDGGDLGYTLAQPSVVRLQDGNWAVIVANGYNSDNGHAVLFVLDALSGVVLQKIDTGAGNTANKNGLSSPVAVDTNNDRSVDTVYAGDLYGNLWKFDVSGSAGNYPVPTSPFFVACTTSGTSCGSANRQPITGKPNVGAVGAVGTDQNGVGLMVYFGTGKYFEIGDNLLPALPAIPQVQTFYGLWDQGSAITDRLNLQEQSIDVEGVATLACTATSSCSTSTTTTRPIRVVSKNSVCYAATNAVGCTSTNERGWALDLKSPASGAQGERVVSFPLVRRGVVVFATAIPDPDACASGGKSWLMEVDALGGGAPGGAPFDTNGDGKVDANDFVIVTINGVKVTVPASGIDLGVGIHKQPAKIESASGVDYGYVSGSDAKNPDPVTEAGGSGGVGMRRYWRQLK